MLIKYHKEFSRNYSLFQAVVYDRFARFGKNQEYGVSFYIGQPLLVHDGSPLVGLYYQKGDLKKIFDQFRDKQFDARFFERVLNDLYLIIDRISPYFHKEKEIKTREELRLLFELYYEFYFFDSVVWVIPVAMVITEELRLKFLAVREDVQDLSQYRDEVFDYYLLKLFPDFGDLVHFLHPDSVFGGKTTGELKREGEENKKGFVLYDSKFFVGHIPLILKKLDIEIVDSLVNKDIKEFRGEIAAKGKASGVVKIVLTGKEIDKVKDGDVLVSPMTRPEFLPAMKRAVAFITDEGGITCHAAIVSRELKKPCIIGTKIATQVLKDGYLVEVDADRGVVRIMEN